jgi:hypothetical protein
MIRGRRLLPVSLLIAVALVVASCGGSMSMGEYAEAVETLVVTQNARLDALDAQYGPSTDLNEIRTFARERVAARQRLVDGLEALDPPDTVADLHAEAISILRDLTAAEAAMAELVEEADDIESISNLWSSPEGVVARQADERAIRICEAAEASFDRSRPAAELEGVPWVPPELQEVINVTFGCRASDRVP